MKGYCFLVLTVAFLMYFQKEPVFTVVILVIAVGLYLFIKARKSGKGIFGFLGGNEQPYNDRMNDMMTLLLLQQLFSQNDNPNEGSILKSTTQDLEQEKLKQEVMELFEKYDSPQKKKKQSLEKGI